MTTPVTEAAAGGATGKEAPRSRMSRRKSFWTRLSHVLTRLGPIYGTLACVAIFAVVMNILLWLAILFFDAPTWSERPFSGAAVAIIPGVVGGALAYLGLGTISRLRRAEQAARESEQKFRDIADGSVQGLCIQKSFDVVYANMAFARLFGFTSVEDMIEYGSMLPLIPETHRAEVLANVEARVRGDIDDQPLLHPALRMDGTEVWLESHFRVVRWDGVPSLQIASVDVGNRRKLERLKDEFIATVSHELRTPLTSITGSLALVASGMSGPVSDETKRLIEIAQTNSERLTRLVNEILDVEKIEAGRLQIRFDTLDPLVLLREAVQVSRWQASEAGVSIEVAGSDTGERIAGGREHLIQVLINLLSNAIKFSPRGSAVTAGVRRTGDRIRFEVIDRGAGIPEHFKPHVFERFARADSSDARRQGGAGLGLSICKMLVERHLGTMAFQATPGGGTTFWFDLPARLPTAPGEPLLAQARPGQRAAE